MTVNIPLDSLKNKHVSLPVIASFAVEMIQLWAPVWFADHAEAIRQTQRALFAYGILAASTTGGTQTPPTTTPPPATPKP